MVIETEARARVIERELTKDVIQLVMRGPTPAEMRTWWMEENEMLSKASSMSKKTSKAKFPAESADSILRVRRWMTASVEEPLMKPN